MKDLITVIVPVYNVVNYLDKCLESIVKQTYKNLEILVIDDGSDDGSEKICDKYKKKDKRIRVIHKENEGIARTRNLGIKEARGDYIGWVDADDYIDSEMYEILYRTIIEYDADISMCNYIECGDKGIELGNGSGNVVVFDRIQALQELIKDEIITSHSFNKLFKKEVFKRVSCPSNRRYEDVSYIYKTIVNSKKIVYIDKILYAYYQRAGSTVHTLNKKIVSDFYKAYKERNEFLEKKVEELGKWVVSDKIYSVLLLHLLIVKFGDKDLYNLDFVKKAYLEYREIWKFKDLISIKNSKKLLSLLLYINRNLFYVIVSILYKIKGVLM